MRSITGFGNMNDAMLGTDRLERKQPRAIKGDWETHRMPRTRAHFDLGIEISEEEFETLARGHIPTAMADHWFMYFDGEALCFHRSWTGFCIFRVYVSRSKSPGALPLAAKKIATALAKAWNAQCLCKKLCLQV